MADVPALQPVEFWKRRGAVRQRRRGKRKIVLDDLVWRCVPVLTQLTELRGR